MAKYHGRHGVVMLDSDAVGEIQSWEFSRTVAMAETTSMGDTAVYRESTGFKDATGSVTYLYDPDDTGQTSIDIDAKLTLKLYPQGNTTGKPFWSIPVIVSEMGLPQTKDGFVTHSFSWVGNGSITEGTEP